MNKLAVAFAIATVATLNVIIIAGAGLPNSSMGERLITATVPIMDICLAVSSVLFGKILITRGFPRLGMLFIFNIVLFAIAIVLRVTGSVPPRWVLFSVDVYWLHLYLIALSKHWPILSGQSLATSLHRWRNPITEISPS